VTHLAIARGSLALLCSMQGGTTLAIDLNLMAEMLALPMLVAIVALFKY
jgi:hypothetical protein